MRKLETRTLGAANESEGASHDGSLGTLKGEPTRHDSRATAPGFRGTGRDRIADRGLQPSETLRDDSRCLFESRSFLGHNRGTKSIGRSQVPEIS